MLRTAIKSSLSAASRAAVSSMAVRAVGARQFSRRIAVDGNEATAMSAYNVSDTAIIFPITPSSTMGELCDAWSVQNKKNVFEQNVKVIEMQVSTTCTPYWCSVEVCAAGPVASRNEWFLLVIAIYASQTITHPSPLLVRGRSHGRSPRSSAWRSSGNDFLLLPGSYADDP